MVAMFFDETSDTSLGDCAPVHPTNNVQKILITMDFLNIRHATFNYILISY